MPFFTSYRLQNILIVLLGASFAAIVFFMLTTSNRQATENTLVQSARNYSETFTGIRNFYQTEIVQRVAGSNIQIVHDFRKREKAIPIPATMMLELSAYLNSETDDITFSLVSDYPFPWRKQRFLAEFDVRAIEKLRANNASEYYEILEEDGKVILHYASPVLMKEGCVNCHNSHPDSPKRDWKVGDVRAVQIFEMPVNETVRHLDFETSAAAATIIFVGMTTIFALMFLNQRVASTQTLLRQEAYFDVLTGAMRRQRFQEIYDTTTRSKDYYLFLIDIDDFKSFNTNYGHAIGDKVLSTVATNIQSAAPKAEVICRFGGEEFLLLVPMNDVGEKPDQFFNDIVSKVAKNEIEIKDRFTRCTISAGWIPLRTTDDLIKVSEKADAALRYAKRTGKNRAVEAEQDLLLRLGYIDENYKLADIISAIKKKELIFAFQPIVDLETRQTIGYEALIRWQRDGQDLIPPASYLPQYLSALRDQSLLDDVKQMVRRSLPPRITGDSSRMNLSFNYDPYDILLGFEENTLTPVLIELLTEGYKIAIEVTETPYLQDASPEFARLQFNKVASYGFALHLDDFGKDGSGIERLAVHPFATVKSDRSLILDLDTSNRKQQMIALLVQLTAAVGARLVVEGIESEKERTILLDLGVKYAQGYLLGEPQTF